MKELELVELAVKAADSRGARIAMHTHFDSLRERIGGRNFPIK